MTRAARRSNVATEEHMATESHADIRDAVRKLCTRFPGAYWRALDRERAYPSEFVKALTEACLLYTSRCV